MIVQKTSRSGKSGFALVAALILGIGAAGQAAAQSVDEDELFGGGSAAESGGQTSGQDSSNPDDMFQGDNVQTHDTANDTYTEDFLSDEGIKIGGSYALSIGTKLWWDDFVRFEG